MTPDQRKRLIKRSLLWAFGLVLAVTILPWGLTLFLLSVVAVAGIIYLVLWRADAGVSALRPDAPRPPPVAPAAQPATAGASPASASTVTDAAPANETVAFLGLARSSTTAAAPRFVPPTVEELGAALPQFTIEALIGSGGMGAVYRVRQKDLDRVAALKVLPRELAEKTGFQERFAREAKALAGLTHPHLVTVYEVGQDNGWYWLLMELVDGANLREVMKTGRLSPEQALTLVPQLCDALQYAHDRGVVHRDIKPENILLDAAGRLKLTDFGLAKLLGEGEGEDRSTLTQTGTALGTVHYMAPEQVEGARRVDHRADIYAVGVVLYEMLTGGLPLGRFQPPSQQIAVDVRVDEVVLKALEKDPERRYQRAGDVRRDVERVGTPVAVAAPSPGAETAPPAVSTPVVTTSGTDAGDASETDRRFLPAVILALAGIALCGERLGAAFAPLVRHLAEAAQASAAGARIDEGQVVASLPLPEVLPFIGALAGLGMVLGAWSLLTLRARALAPLGGVCSLALAPAVSAIGDKDDLTLAFAAGALLLSLWLLYATVGSRTGRCFARARLAPRGIAVPGTLSSLGWGLVLGGALAAGLGISAYAVARPHAQMLLTSSANAAQTSVVHDGRVLLPNSRSHEIDRAAAAAENLQAIRREFLALVAIVSEYKGLNRKTDDANVPSLEAVLKTLERVRRGDPLEPSGQRMTRMETVERACDDGRAAIAAARASHANGPSSADYGAWPSVMIMERLAEHLRSLDRLFTTLRQYAGDLGTISLRDLRRQAALLEGLTSEQLTQPEPETRAREDICRWWYSREQADLLIDQMRGNRAPAAMVTWLRTVLDSRTTDAVVPVTTTQVEATTIAATAAVEAATPTADDADDPLIRDRSAEARRLLDSLIQEVDRAQAELTARAPELARVKEDALVILRGGIGHLVSSAEGAEVIDGERASTVGRVIVMVRGLIAEARSLDEVLVADAQRSSDQTLYRTVERYRHHLDLADQHAERLKPFAADLGTMRLDEFTTFAKEVAALPDRLRRFNPAERARFAITPGGWLSQRQVRRLERTLRDQQATDDEIRLFREAVSTRITDPCAHPESSAAACHRGRREITRWKSVAPTA